MTQAQQPQSLALVMAHDMRTHAPSFGNTADELERQHYEIADLKEQLTAARIAQPMPPLPWDRPSVESLLERLVTSHISAFLAGERGSNNPEVRDFVKSALVDAAGLIRAVLMDIDALEATKAAAQKHPDDAAVDRFADAMKAKLAQARAKGRSGWQGCDPGELSRMLREHVEKGEPRDVANFCMFLWSLGQPIAQPAAQGMDALAIVEKLPRYTYGYKSDEWGMNRSLRAYQDSAGQFLTRDEVLAALAAQAKQ